MDGRANPLMDRKVVGVSEYLSVYLCFYLSMYLSIYLPTYIPTYLPIYLSIFLSIYLSICRSMYLPLYLSIYLSAEAILRDFLEIWKLTAEKRSCLRDFLRIWKLTTSKTQQFCETSSICEIGNVKNEAILRDFPQKWKVEYGLVPMRFVTAPLHLSKSTAPAAKK